MLSTGAEEPVLFLLHFGAFYRRAVCGGEGQGGAVFSFTIENLKLLWLCFIYRCHSAFEKMDRKPYPCCTDGDGKWRHKKVVMSLASLGIEFRNPESRFPATALGKLL